MEYIYNLKTKIQKSYLNLKINDMVRDVFNTYIKNEDGFDQSISIENTQGEYNFVIPNLTPFETMNFYQKERYQMTIQIQRVHFFFS